MVAFLSGVSMDSVSAGPPVAPCVISWKGGGVMGCPPLQPLSTPRSTHLLTLPSPSLLPGFAAATFWLDSSLFPWQPQSSPPIVRVTCAHLTGPSVSPGAKAGVLTVTHKAVMSAFLLYLWFISSYILGLHWLAEMLPLALLFLLPPNILLPDTSILFSTISRSLLKSFWTSYF